MILKQQRVVIEQVTPQLHCGAFFIKRVVGETVNVHADVLGDGHDVIQAELEYKHEKDKKFSQVRMEHLGNDAFNAAFAVGKQGYYTYRIAGWVDHALNWQHGIEAKIKDGQHVKSELLDGIKYLEFIQKKAGAQEKAYLKNLSDDFSNDDSYETAIAEAVSDKLHQLFLDYPQRFMANTSAELQVYVDRKKATFSTWYEFFPRSSSSEPGTHGTFKDCERLLDRIANMGFDTIYFPPIHPIGEVNRKGKNNVVDAKQGDSGVPWAIGSRLGGHKSIHPELGTEEDFKTLVKKANDMDLEIALDLAFQAAPDHPYITTNPEWFRKRPDGTMQYAENPPKKYQDIVNFYFESSSFKELWAELLNVTLHWIGCGVKIFRVDNPHTKPYYFLELAYNRSEKRSSGRFVFGRSFLPSQGYAAIGQAGFLPVLYLFHLACP